MCALTKYTGNYSDSGVEQSAAGGLGEKADG